jgi:mevalonate kinase
MKHHPNSSKEYYSKLLLFGEHTILKGSQALAMPFPRFFGKWEYLSASSTVEEIKSSQQTLPQFLAYLTELEASGKLIAPFKLNQLEVDLTNKLFFNSSIPTGYGLGSSGALCAALFDKYKKEDEHGLTKLKLIFSQLESFFHGSSSGVDPLICFLNQSLFFHSKEKMSVTSIPSQNTVGKGAIFLLDTEISRQTGPLVQIFLAKCKDVEYNQMCKRELVPEVNRAIGYFLNATWSSLFQSFHHIGFFQYHFFEEMIPSSYKELWLRSIQSSLYKLKLCGAGGGGFILGMTLNWEDTQKELNKNTLIPVFRF